MTVALNGRAIVRSQVGGVERWAVEVLGRLCALRPERYVLLRPPVALAHRAGHAWEQAVLPLRARAAGADAIFSPANLAPLAWRRNVVVIHDVSALRHPDWFSAPYAAWQSRVLPAIANRARLVVTVSEFSRRELLELLDLDAARTVVAPGAAGPAFRVGVDPQPARAALGLEREYVLTVATPSARKNLQALAQAASDLEKLGMDLVAAGAGRGYLPAAATPLRSLGYVADEHLPGLYAGARAFVLPSRYEGFGLPCVEAMACGTPVVAADAGALPETCGDAALLVDPIGGDEISDAIVRAATDDALRAGLVAAGLERARGYSWDATATRVDGLLSAG